MKKYIYQAFSALALMTMVALLPACQQKQISVFMAGDSTMADRPDTTITAERGWGQVFPTYLSDNITIRNHAKNGRSTKSFLAEGRWEDVKKDLQKGDVVIIQFGHNDTKQDDSVRYTPVGDYEKNLCHMIEEAKAMGAQPVLCTPIARRAFSKETGELVNKHGDYPDAARRAAQTTGVPLVDMTAITMDWLRAVGDEPSVKYFAHMEPGKYSKYPDGKIDNTHLSLLGAREVAYLFANAVKQQKINPLYRYIQLEKDASTQYSVPCNIK